MKIIRLTLIYLPSLMTIVKKKTRKKLTKMKARRLISTYLRNLISMNLTKAKYLSWKTLGMSLKEKWSKQMKVTNSPSPHPNHQKTRRDVAFFPFPLVNRQPFYPFHPHSNHSTQNFINSKNPLRAQFQTARRR